MSKDFMEAYRAMGTCKHIATDAHPDGAPAPRAHNKVQWRSDIPPNERGQIAGGGATMGGQARIEEDFAASMTETTDLESTLAEPRMCLRMTLQESFNGKTQQALNHFKSIAESNYGLSVSSAKLNKQTTIQMVVEGDAERITAFRASLNKQKALKKVETK